LNVWTFNWYKKKAPSLPTEKNHGQKHGAACTARMQPAPAQRIASQTIRAPCSAAQRIASQPSRSASARASACASHPVQRSAPRECNQPPRSALHRKQSAHRAAHRPHRQPARRASTEKNLRKSAFSRARALCSCAREGVRMYVNVCVRM
jgi:hypothetical protein